MNIFKINKNYKQNLGALVLTSQLFSVLAPLTTFAAPQSASATDTQNALETVGTKANRLKTLGASGVDESSGAFTYSYPLTGPKGKMGVEPNLSISYNSQSGENSIFGYGWQMTIPSIERSAKKGVDKIYTNSDYVSTLGGELILKPGYTNTYIQKIDDGSFQEYTLSNNIWTLRDRSGNTYTFGLDTDSRLFDLANSTKISRFYLSETRDLLGNRVKYIYEKKDNFVYLKEVRYTLDKNGNYSNKIVIEREPRLDTEKSYRTQFLVEMKERVKTIRTYTDNIENARYEFSYTTGQNGTRSLLSAIKESRLGTDGLWSSVPETKFEYSNYGSISPSLSWVAQQDGQQRIDINGDALPEWVNTNINSQTYTILDVNGDYFNDMYTRYQYLDWYRGLVDQNANEYRKNTGVSFLNLPISFKNFPVNFTQSNNASTSYYYYPVTSTIDLNADGLTDIISTNSFNGTSGVYLNVNGDFQKTNFYQTDYESLAADINGDGLYDKVLDYASSTNPSLNGRYVYLNNGISWNSFPELNYKIVPVKTVKSVYSIIEFDAGLRYTDINGDGLTDVYRSYNSNQQFLSPYTSNIAPNDSVKELYLNTGSGFNKIENPAQLGFAVNYTSNGCCTPKTENNFPEESSNIKKQDILKTVTSPLGAKSEISYIGSASTGLNPKLPINMQVVDKVVETETNKNISETTSYTFENGKMYFDEANVYDRRFAGFQKVTTTKGQQKSVKYFHQGDGDDATTFERGDSIHNIGRVYKEEVWGGATKLSDSYRTYGSYTYLGQTYKYPKEEVNTKYDTSGGKITTATTYDYDLAARLPKEVKNWGEVTFDISTNTILDKGDDLVVTKNLTNTSRPQKILSEESFDADGNFLDKKYYFYDGLPFGYVEKGLVTQVRDYSSASKFVKTTTTYNDLGLPVTSSDQNGFTTTTTYDENNNPKTVTNTLGQTVAFKYDKVTGLLLEQTDPNGKFVQNVYDGFGNKIKTFATLPSGAVGQIYSKNISYLSSGLQAIENIFKDGVAYKDTLSTYDSFGRTLSVKSKIDSQTYSQVDSTYNNLGQLVSTSYPYDPSGIFSVFNPSLSTTFSYDEIGRPVKSKQGDNESYVTYLVNGKIVSDNSGHKKKYVYNTLGKISSVSEYLGTTEQVTKYSWNLLGKLTKIVDAENNIRNFSYDAEGRLLKQEDLHAPADNTFGIYKYEYDALGNLLSKQDPSGNVFAYKYDSLYRPVSEASSDIFTTYTYDTCLGGIGQLCKVQNSEYIQNLTYGKTGQIETEEKIIDQKNFKNIYSYDSLGQLTRVTLPDNSQINYSYEINGKQKSAQLVRNISGVASTTKIVDDAKYNIDGTVKEITFGNALKNCYEYSTTSGGSTAPRLTGIFVNQACSSRDDAKNLFSEKITYNLDGKIASTEDAYVGGASPNKNTFTYDSLDRLTAYSNLSGGLTTNYNFSYSSIGNILTAGSKNYTYSGTEYQNPHAASLIGTDKLIYDLNGNVLSDGKNIYTWSKKNTIKTVNNQNSESIYTYDISGERIKEKVRTSINRSATDTQIMFDNVSSLKGQIQNVITGPDTYVTEDTFNFLQNNRLNAKTKVELLFDLALDNDYIKSVCKGDVVCFKKQAQQFIGTYLYQKYNILATPQNLEEMWGLYSNKLLLARSETVYDFTLATPTKITISLPACWNSYDPGTKTEQKCENNINLSALQNKNLKYYLNYSIRSWFRDTYNLNILLAGNILEQNLAATTSATLDLSKKLNSILPSMGSLTSIPLKITGTSYAAVVNNSGMIMDNISLEAYSFSYNNKINIATTTTLTNGEITNKIVNKGDTGMYGAVYKETKIPALFANDKLISKETFAEIQNLNISITNLVIYDKLVESSMTGAYDICKNILDEEQNYNCRKTVFVKYLYAIVKYEKDKDLSTIALDEIFEVLQGHNTVPSDISDYLIRETKTYSKTDNNYNTERTVFWYSLGADTNAVPLGICELGGYYNGQTHYRNCSFDFVFPQEIYERRDEIESATINPIIQKGYDTVSGGNYAILPYSTPQPYLKSSDGLISTTPVLANLSEVIILDVSALVKSIAKGISSNRVKFLSAEANGHSYISNAGKLDLVIVFAKTAPQNESKFITPLVTNPKDTDVYAKVLQVLARIDKNYLGGENTIISQTAYNEIKNTNLKNVDDVKNLFNTNSHLQNDQTFLAVYDALRTTQSATVTRETLEELYLVSDNKLQMPTEVSQYLFTEATTTKVALAVGTSTVKSYFDIISTANITENGVALLQINLKPNFKIFDRKTLTNLSVVSGVPSERNLITDLPFTQKQNISRAAFTELKSANINTLSDLQNLAGINASTSISRSQEISLMQNIYKNTLTQKNIKLTRETLQEAYYALSGYLLVADPDLGVPQNSGTPALDPAVGNYWKFDGVVNTVNKRKDEFSNLNITENGSQSTSGYKNDLDGAYKFPQGNYNKAFVNKTFGSQAFTLSYWANFTNNTDGYMMNLSMGNNERAYVQTGIFGNSLNPWFAWNSGGTNKEIGGYVASKTLTPAVWHKFDYVFENAPNATMKIYVDGILYNSFTGTVPFTLNATNPATPYINFACRGAGDACTSVSIDNTKIYYNKALTQTQVTEEYNKDLTGGTSIVYTKYPIFDQKTLGVLEPVFVDGVKVLSTTETSLENNKTYSVAVEDVKLVSDDTMGELGLAGITTRQQIVDIMQKTRAVYKDSKISFFNTYMKENKNISFSRLALEEIYLLYSEQAIFPTTDIGTSTLKVVQNIPLNTFRNDILNTTNTCTSIGTTAENTYPNYSCKGAFSFPKKYGYNLTSARLNISGEIQHNYYTYIKLVANINGQSVEAQNVLDLSKYMVIKGGDTVYPLELRNSSGGINALINPGNVSVELVYSPVTQKFTKENFGDLEDISPVSKLDKSYASEIALDLASSTFQTVGTTSILSDQTLAELASTTLSQSETKNFFTSATTTWSKETKLYSFYKYLQTKYSVNISRLALEELWNVGTGRESFPNATSTVSLPPVTEVKSMTLKDTQNTNGDMPANYCLSWGGRFNSECYLKFGNITTPNNYTLQSAKVVWNFNNRSSKLPYTIYFARPLGNVTNSPYPLRVSLDKTDGYTGSIDISGTKNISNETDITNIIKKNLTDTTKYDHDLAISTQADATYWAETWFALDYDGQNGIYGIRNPYLSLTWSGTSVSLPTVKQSRDELLPYTSTSSLEYLKQIYETQTGDREVIYTITEDMVKTGTTSTSSLPLLADQTISTSSILTTEVTTPIINISTENLTKLNPNNYPYTVIDSNSITIYINNLPYEVTLTNYLQFYSDLAKANIDTIAKYSRQYSEYTKYTPSTYYSEDSNNIIEISIPFNGKVVATYKYVNVPNTKTTPEISYLHNTYNQTVAITTNELATTTSIIKRDVWGKVTSTTLDSDLVTQTNIGYTNQKDDMQSELMYDHARSYSYNSKLWLSQDDASINGFNSEYFLLNPQYQNSYSYVSNNPVNNVDPDGRIVIVINGTQFFGTNKNWNVPVLMESIRNDDHFKGQAIGQFNWDGADNNKSRNDAAKALHDFIENTMKMYPGEDINLVAHSHGGQVIALYSQMKDARQMKNVITIETPNIGVTFNEAKIDNHVHTYSHGDLVQYLGGSQINMGLIMGAIIVGTTGMIGVVPASMFIGSGIGQFGIAQRTFDGANNVDITSLQKTVDPKDTGLYQVIRNSLQNHFIDNSGNKDVYSKAIRPNLK